MLNAIIAVSLLVFVRYFFEMLKQKMDELGVGYSKAYSSLKCALCTLCATFFLRFLLMLILVCEIGINAHNKIDTVSILDMVVLTIFLLFGELLPIFVIFLQHYQGLRGQPEPAGRGTETSSMVINKIEALSDADDLVNLSRDDGSILVPVLRDSETGGTEVNCTNSSYRRTDPGIRQTKSSN